MREKYKPAKLLQNLVTGIKTIEKKRKFLNIYTYTFPYDNLCYSLIESSCV